MKLSSIFITKNPWMRAREGFQDIFLGLMGRMVRSLDGHPFPGWSSDESRAKVLEILRPAIKKQAGYARAFHSDIADIARMPRMALLERKLMSPSFANRQAGCELFIPKKQDMIVMLNEEEHMVLHAFSPNGDMDGMLKKMQKFADKVEALLEESAERFAYNNTQGYLTSIPSECGEGVQFYMLHHLPMLTSIGALPKIRHALDALGLGIQAFYADEEEEDKGNLFFIFSKPSPISQSADNIQRLTAASFKLIQQEHALRNHMLEEDSLLTRDLVGRAYGTIKYAQSLTFKELTDCLSLIKMGVSLGLLTSELNDIETDDIINEIDDANLSLAPAQLRTFCIEQLEIEVEQLENSNHFLHVARAQLAHLMLKKLALTSKELSPS